MKLLIALIATLILISSCVTSYETHKAQYKQEMDCVYNLVNKGIPRNQITHSNGTCHVKEEI